MTFARSRFQQLTLLKPFLIIMTLCTSVFFSMSALALDSDRDQPIEISADSAELNEGKGFSIYSGNVMITQGSMVIEATSVKITFNDNGIQTMLASEGTHEGRAYMRQTAEGPKAQLMEAWGKTIDYQITGELLTLLGNATLIQKGNHFSGEKIVFDIPQDNVKATGGGNNRVEMIFLPNKK